MNVGSSDIGLSFVVVDGEWVERAGGRAWGTVVVGHYSQTIPSPSP